MSAVPMRTCVGCRAKSPQSRLVRVARVSDGSVQLDRASVVGGSGGRVQGRGAYLCPRRSCIVRARRSGALRRALGVDVAELVDELLRMFPEREEQREEHG